MKKYIIILILLFSINCFGADVNILEMTEDTSPTSDDIIYVINAPGGTPADRKATLGNIIIKAHGLSGENYIITLDASGVMQAVDSISGVTFGGFTASQGVQSDASGNLVSSGAAPGAVTQIGTFAAPITTNPYSLTNGYNVVLWYGATGEIDLPSAVAGMNIIIYNTGAFTITIDPNGSDVIVRDGTAQAGGVTMTLSSGAGNYVVLVCDTANHWVTLGYKGTLSQGS